MSKNQNNIEIRSEEIQEIIGHIPNWLIRWGITVIFGTIIVLFIGSAFFKFPDVITSPIVVTTENPPENIIARINGKIDTILVNDKQEVSKNQVLAIIKNPANYDDVNTLLKTIDTINIQFINNQNTSFFFSNLILGELQINYSSFQKSLSDYINFFKINYHQQKINAIKQQVSVTNKYIANLNQQKNIIYKELVLAKKQIKRDSSLLSAGAISMADFETTQSNYFQKKYTFENAKATISNTKIQISKLEQTILDLQLDYINQKNQLKIELQKNLDILKSAIKTWELTYVLKTSINGQIIFSKIWSENQNIVAEDNVFNILPFKRTLLTGRLQLPIQGAGKVKINQNVNIKFLNFPYMEYGIVKAQIKSISPVPTENYYIVLVYFPDSLTTNYGIKLPFSQEMQGTAEIITQNISLLNRLFSPIKYIKKKFRNNG